MMTRETLIQQIRDVSGQDDVRQILGCPDFYVAANGSAWSLRPPSRAAGKLPNHPRRLTTRKWLDYDMISVRDTTGKQYQMTTLRAVGLAFTEVPEGDFNAVPKDGDHRNAIPDNVEWISSSELAKRHNKKWGELVRTGDYQPMNGSLTDDQVRNIRKLKKQGISTLELCARFNLKRRAINRIVRGESWAHVK